MWAPGQVLWSTREREDEGKVSVAEVMENVQAAVVEQAPTRLPASISLHPASRHRWLIGDWGGVMGMGTKIVRTRNGRSAAGGTSLQL